MVKKHAMSDSTLYIGFFAKTTNNAVIMVSADNIRNIA
jgi:hypothetical protein